MAVCMKKHFKFDTAEPLLRFLYQNKERIIGQHIRRFYSSTAFGEMSATPLAFELDDYSIVISYYFCSSMNLYVVDSDSLKNDLSLNFLYQDKPESRNLRQWISEAKFPYLGQAVEDICISRFSHEFEINPSTRETRPDGGDYFSAITVVLSSGREFNICAADSICDGYIEIW